MTPQTVKILNMGYPKTGKTGCMASLINAGYKLRLVSFDPQANLLALKNYIDKDKRDHLEYIVLRDKIRMGPKGQTLDGAPTAFRDADRVLAGKLDPDKYSVAAEWGPTNEWPEDMVLALDPLGGLGKAAMNFVLALTGKVETGPKPATWMKAQNEQELFIERLNDDEVVSCNLVVNAHIVVIGPKAPMMSDDNDDEAENKTQILDRELELIPHRLYPNALGRALPPKISSHFGVVVRAETLVGGRRVISTIADPSLDIAVPAKVAGQLPVGTGLATIFDALRKGA